MELKTKKIFIQFTKTCIKYFVLCIYNSTELIQLEMDIKNFVVKTCLKQKYNNKRHLIAYYLKKMLKIKQNYDIHDKKLLAIIEAFKQ